MNASADKDLELMALRAADDYRQKAPVVALEAAQKAGNPSLEEQAKEGMA